MAVIYDAKANYTITPIQSDIYRGTTGNYLTNYLTLTDTVWQNLTTDNNEIVPTLQGYGGIQGTQGVNLTQGNITTQITCTQTDYTTDITVGSSLYWTPATTTNYTITAEYTTTVNGYELPAGNIIQGEVNATNGYVVYDTGAINVFGYAKVPEEIRKQIRRSRFTLNLAPPNIKTRADLVRDVSEKEKVALESLREIITETEFRKYLKYGFVLVKGRSGDTYQIFRNKSHTKVYRGSKLIEDVCVRIKDVNVPGTDNVIAFVTMLQAGDEQEFRRLGNVFKHAA